MIRTLQIVLVGLLLSASVQAVERHVPEEYATIQAAIDAANAGDVVIIADGTYTGEGNRDIDFLGKAITVRSANGPENCVVRCQASDTGLHRGFYFHNAEDDRATLKGITITGFMSDTLGAVECSNSSPTIDGCVIDGNEGVGVLITVASSAQILSCTISDNGHGGILIDDSATFNGLIQDCKITGNTLGGGIHARGHGTTTVTGCHITGNTCAGYSGGGGISCYSETTVISDCRIANNIAYVGTYDLQGGGGVCAVKGAVTIRRCTIRGNSSTGSGGGIRHFTSSQQLTVENCLIMENSCDNANPYYPCMGGGLYAESNTTTVRNCTFVGNSADMGGAIYCSSNCEVANCTIVDNQILDVQFRGGGIYADGSSSLSFRNNIIFNNERCGLVLRHEPAVEHNLFFDNPHGDVLVFENVYADGTVYTGADQINTLSFADGNIDGDPLFVSGPKGDHYLSQTAAGQSQTSPAVDAGSALASALGMNQLTTRTDGVGDSGQVDIGRHYGPDDPPMNCRLTTIVSGGHGSLAPESGNYYPVDTVVQLVAQPEDGYQVRAWHGTDDNDSTSTNNTVTMDDDKTVTVEFEIITYNLTATAVGDGTVSPEQGVYPSGTRVSLTATPASDCRVRSWSGTDDDQSTSRYNTVTMTADANVSVTMASDLTATAEADPETIVEGEDSVLTGTALGGLEPYAYRWSTGQPGAKVSVSPRQTTDYELTVSDASGQQITAETTVTVVEVLSAAIEADQPTILPGGSCCLTADLSGGLQPYIYRWSTGEGTDSITVSPDQQTKYSVTVTDSLGQQASAETTVNVADPVSVTVTAQPSQVRQGESSQLRATATGGLPPYIYAWSNGGSGETTTVRPTETATYDVVVTDALDQQAQGQVTVTVGSQPSDPNDSSPTDPNPADPNDPNASDPNDPNGTNNDGQDPLMPAGPGCFIATAAYGSYLEPQVVVLRNLRDNYLLTNGGGRWLVGQYYQHSPPLATVIAAEPCLRWMVRMLLTPLVYGLKYPLPAMLLLGTLAVIAFRLMKKLASVGKASRCYCRHA